jgi:hypothetical protein
MNKDKLVQWRADLKARIQRFSETLPPVTPDPETTFEEFKAALPAKTQEEIRSVLAECRARVRELIEAYAFADCGPDDFGCGPCQEAIAEWVDEILATIVPTGERPS